MQGQTRVTGPLICRNTGNAVLESYTAFSGRSEGSKNLGGDASKATALQPAAELVHQLLVNLR